MLDFSDVKLSWRPNQFLMLPDGFAAKSAPHATSPIFAATPQALIQAIKRVAFGEPRTILIDEDAETCQVEFVQRSRIFRFPDRISIAAYAKPNGAALAIYSRSRIGIRDFGVNRARVARWIARLPC